MKCYSAAVLGWCLFYCFPILNFSVSQYKLMNLITYYDKPEQWGLLKDELNTEVCQVYPQWDLEMNNVKVKWEAQRMGGRN